MEEFSRKFGFGCMRLPMLGEDVDLAQTCFFRTEEDIRPLFESQLAACGVDYF